MLLGTSCRSSRTTQRTKGKGNLPKVSYSELQSKRVKIGTGGQLISIKSKVHFKTAKMSDSFKMHVRMKKDSVIWISATFYRVEVARFIFTPDSVKMLDRKNSKFYIGDYTFIQNKYSVPFDFNGLQAVLLGEQFEMENYSKVRVTNAKGMYLLSGIGQSEFKKKNGEVKVRQQQYSVWFDPESYLVQRSKIVEQRSKKSFSAKYIEWAQIEDIHVPKLTEYEIRDTEQMSFNADYLKVSLPEKLSYPFSVSSKYEPLF